MCRTCISHRTAPDPMGAIPSENESETRIRRRSWGQRRASVVYYSARLIPAVAHKWTESNTWTVVSRSRLMAMRYGR